MARPGVRWIAAASVLAVLLAAVAGRPQRASAHVLEQDGDVSAVLHMPPDDAPQAGKLATFDLSFAGKQPGFAVANYDITLAISHRGRRLQTIALTSLKSSAGAMAGSAVLPEAGAYQLVVSGQPKIAGQGFRLVYDIRASGGTYSGGGLASQHASFAFWAVCAGSWAILVVVARQAIHTRGRYRR